MTSSRTPTPFIPPEPGVIRMRRALDPDITPVSWPNDVYLAEFTPNNAPDAHSLLTTTTPFVVWWSNLLSDPEYDPTLCFLLYDDQGIVAMAQCWTSAFIKDLVVHPRRRNQGIGAAMLQHVFYTFNQRGAIVVDLKVNGDNQPAIQLYLSVGMWVVEPK